MFSRTKLKFEFPKPNWNEKIYDFLNLGSSDDHSQLWLLCLFAPSCVRSNRPLSFCHNLNFFGGKRSRVCKNSVARHCAGEAYFRAFKILNGRKLDSFSSFAWRGLCPVTQQSSHTHFQRICKFIPPSVLIVDIWTIQLFIKVICENRGDFFGIQAIFPKWFYPICPVQKPPFQLN